MKPIFFLICITVISLLTGVDRFAISAFSGVYDGFITGILRIACFFYFGWWSHDRMLSGRFLLFCFLGVFIDVLILTLLSVAVLDDSSVSIVKTALVIFVLNFVYLLMSSFVGRNTADFYLNQKRIISNILLSGLTSLAGFLVLTFSLYGIVLFSEVPFYQFSFNSISMLIANIFYICVGLFQTFLCIKSEKIHIFIKWLSVAIFMIFVYLVINGIMTILMGVTNSVDL